MNLTSRNLNRIIKGETSSISFKYIEEFCQYLNCTPGELITYKKESQQRKSMEMMQLYKKYKISMAGCFMPFIQMPIFLAFFETLRRVPSTSSTFEEFVKNAGEIVLKGEGTIKVSDLLFDFKFLDTSIFGIDLFKGTEGGQANKVGIWILAVLVAGTQLATQYLSQRRNKKQNNYFYNESDIAW